MRDSSLDEFLDAGTDGSTEEADEDRGGDRDGDGDGPADPDAGDDPSGDGDAERAGDAPDGRSVEPAIRRVVPDPAPAASTYAFSPDGATCAACGASVERRWRDDDAGGLVCGDCKGW